MPNMQKEKTVMPHQEPTVRNKNFSEVSLGYTAEMAINEAARCLNCKNKPCVGGCPVNVEIPDFISHIVNGDFEGAYSVISNTNSLPAVCGRVCPQEKQCEARCVRGIKGESVGIGRLERFAADYHIANNTKSDINIEPNGHKIAVIGSGPSGISCASTLAKMGYSVTVFEAFHTAGGVLVYGIPEFRLPKSIVKHEVDELKSLGVKIETNMVIGKILTIDELFEDGFEAVYVGTGAGLPRFMGIKGEELVGVYSANEFLTRINLMKSYKDEYDTCIIKPNKVAIVGGGNVAMDAARCAKRLGAEDVYIIYRRSEEEMPARAEEVEHAKEEEIEFKLLTNPVEIVGNDDGRVCGIRCVEMELSKPDESGRRSPVEKPDSEFIVDVDCVVMAVGNTPNPLLPANTEGLNTDSKGRIIVNDNSETSKKSVYAGGDAVSGAATVILAMGAGRKAAMEIDKRIKEEQA